MSAAPRLVFALFASLAVGSLARAQGYLGLDLEPAEGGEGLVIRGVLDGSPAEKAGLREGDRILRFAGEELSGDFEEFASAVRTRKPGETVALVVRRGHDEKTIRVRLGRVSDEKGPSVQVERDPEGRKLVVREVEKTEKKGKDEGKQAWLGVHLRESEEGDLEIVQVLDGSPAERVGLEAGDRLVLFNGRPGSEIWEAIRRLRPGEEVELEVERGGESQSFVVVLGDPSDRERGEKKPEGKKKGEGEARGFRITEMIPGRVRALVRTAPPERARLPLLSLRPEAAPAPPGDQDVITLLEEVRALRREVRDLRALIERRGRATDSGR